MNSVFDGSVEISLEETVLRREMVDAGASFFQRGYATGSAGNLSLKLPDGNILTTPTGSSLGILDASSLSKISVAGEWLSGLKPSKEAAFHLSLYQNDPNCQAVVHLHSTYLTALSCRTDLDKQNAIRPFTPYVVMRMGNIPVVPYFRPGDARLGECLGELAVRHNAFLLANHGSVVTGNSLREAANNAEELEETAKLMFILKEYDIRYLSDEEIHELRTLYA